MEAVLEGKSKEVENKRKAGTEKKKCDRVVIGLGIVEYLTDQDLNFKHQATRLNRRVKIFKAQAKLLT